MPVNTSVILSKQFQAALTASIALITGTSRDTKDNAVLARMSSVYNDTMVYLLC